MLGACREQSEHCTDHELLNVIPVNKHTRFLTYVGQKRLFVLCFALVQKTCLQAASTFFWFHNGSGLSLAAQVLQCATQLNTSAASEAVPERDAVERISAYLVVSDQCNGCIRVWSIRKRLPGTRL